MSDLPVPKFRIGDTVYRGTAESTVRSIPCPDCLGSKKWKVITPAGNELTCGCGRCGSYGGIRLANGKALPRLAMREWTPVVQSIVIGAVRIDTADRENPVEYMSSTTGSGSIYYEKTLRATEAEARADAEAACAVHRTVYLVTSEALQAMHVGLLSCELAAQQATWHDVYRAWDYTRWHTETIDAVLDETPAYLLKTRDEIVEYLTQRKDELERYDFIVPHPFEGLLTAARASTDQSVLDAVGKIDAKYPHHEDATA